MRFLDKVLSERSVPSVLGNYDFPHFEEGRADGEGLKVAEELWKKRRAEIVDTLSKEEYGYLPPAVDYDIEIVSEKNTCAMKAVMREVRMTLHCPKGDYVLPFFTVIPAYMRKVPMFVCINFRAGVPDSYVPMEEIVDNGFGLAAVYYRDISDDSDKPDGVYPLFDRDETYGYGKISLWAWGCSRILDYLLTLPNVDQNRVAVIGHSRLGKTALWCGANDERFSIAISNDSGCAGAAIYRGKVGERIENISKNFPFWFCKNYMDKYVPEHDPLQLPYDQNFLVAAMAPRAVYVASAEQDDWADPVSEYLSCVSASEIYEHFGMQGFKVPDRLPETGESFHQGFIGYHLRFGGHYFSREDWNNYFKFRNRHGV